MTDQSICPALETDHRMRAAAIQMNSTADRGRNRATAEQLVRKAAAAGARLVVLPEKWNVLGGAAQLAAGAEPLDGPSTGWARELARELGIDLLAGSIVELRDDGRRANTSVHIGPDGELKAVYRKLHLFDVEVAGVVYRESDGEDAGEEIVATRLADGTVLGMAICYDLRFPELFRILTLHGARVLALPSAFTLATTRDHWETLLRARAIENQCYVVAANQIGEHEPGKASGGRSLIADPWGTVLATAPDDEGFALAELDFARQDAIRARLPALEHRRPDVYAWPARAGAV
ncbi:MAG TPA: carbon-nitrogen hydrolase family protein [Conexibacter sp.]|nr:carbon-nitrogen hydrolase family protein [Conexibacter sp.]